VAKQAEARARHPNTGVCWGGTTSPAPEVEPIETVRQRLVRQDQELRAYQASPLGKARAAIVAAQRICRLNTFAAAYMALDAVDAALDRNPRAGGTAVERLQDALVALPEGDAKVGLLVLGTELKVLVAQLAEAA
jgi:hypothetical protein